MNSSNQVVVKKQFKTRLSVQEDGQYISKFDRTPNMGDKTLECYSLPISYKIRPSLTKKAFILVAQDPETQDLAGSISCSVKNMRVNGEVKSIYYTFDMLVTPNYRNQRISNRLLSDLAKVIEKDCQESENGYESLVTAGTTTTNIASQRGFEGIGFQRFQQQVQFAWDCNVPIPLTPLPAGTTNLKIWKETSKDLIKKRWDNAFQQYQLTPSDFNELLVDNSKYHLTTYVAMMEVNGVVSEASISIWNQDLILTLQDRNGQQKSHRQLYSCYAIGSDQSQNDVLFSYLLRHVHNDQYKQGVQVLFMGMSQQDPLTKHFPLIPKYKSLSFVSLARIPGQSNHNLINPSTSFATDPKYNDPRDYGTLQLFIEQPTNHINIPKSKL